MIRRPDLYDDEKMLSYAKYYYINPDPFNPLAEQLLRRQLSDDEVVKPEDAAKMFAPGYQGAAFGYQIQENASYSTAYMQLHGVTIDMLDWWFVWMCVPPKTVKKEHGNLRYKIWCPMDHFSHYPSDEWSYNRLTDENIPLRLRRQGINDTSIESIDLGKSGIYKELHQHITVNTELSLSQENWDYINSVGTYTLFNSDHSVSIQFYRKTAYGCEGFIRTWRGYVLVDGKIVKTAGYETPTNDHLIEDIRHSTTEIMHLQKFLPSLYAEESMKPIAAY